MAPSGYSIGVCSKEITSPTLLKWPAAASYWTIWMSCE
jgi:hypothetical protein